MYPQDEREWIYEQHDMITRECWGQSDLRHASQFIAMMDFLHAWRSRYAS
jgi:hypothetical protein